MEFGREKRLVLVIASVVALSFLLVSDYRRRRSRKVGLPPKKCYLHGTSKPQHSFKRLSTDNSYYAFNHLSSCASRHPYEDLILELIENPRIHFISCSPDQGNGHSAVKPLADSCVWVGTEAQLSQLAHTLSKEKAFAVDTEQHSLRSFLGFTALMQISTETHDFLVDTVALHDAMEILRPVFADASICKVFHGADGDVVWLQRDFQIYVVNLFDTAKACEVLSKPHKSLAYLLEAYCGVAKNKLLQLEDWRQRPLSMEMVQYARTDVHYLLYVARCLIAELQYHENEYSSCPDDKLRFVLEASRRSNMVCMQLFSKEIEDFPGKSSALSILSRKLNGQGSVPLSNDKTKFQDLVRQLSAWRDIMARIHDESIRFVLSDLAIVALANECPTTEADILSIIAQADLIADKLNSSPSFSSPSPLICCHWNDMLEIIHDDVGNLDDKFAMIVQRCLGPKGTCPLSILNYALLMNSNLKLISGVVSKKNEVKYPKQMSKKASRELFIKKFSCKSPVYHNCRIFANDGRLLCYCDRRKLEWYLRRGLAKLIDDDPLAIILLFEPKGRPEDEGNDFYIQSKRNICVGCGEGNHYLRYRIIPSCYRIHFPEHLKSHRSHDIVLLCVDCHEISHAAAEKYKKQIAVEFGIPLYVNRIVDSNQAPVMSDQPNDGRNSEDLGVSPLQLRTAAKALLRHGHEMPPSRCEELTQIVSRYYGGRDISREDLERASLVGMSPHEKRRLEKKKGLSLSILSDKEQLIYYWECTNHATIPHTSKVDNEDVRDVTLGFSHGTKEWKNSDVSSPLGFNDGGDKTVSARTCIENCTGGSELADSKCVHGFRACDYYVDNIPPSGSINSSSLRYRGNLPPKHHLKFSLLGHGPHGKQVVDHLLGEYGEEGIREFCQRWRQVFVEAVQPQFLPVGWDILHSGRREFGEFSVYRPAKRAAGCGGT